MSESPGPEASGQQENPKSFNYLRRTVRPDSKITHECRETHAKAILIQPLLRVKCDVVGVCRPIYRGSAHLATSSTPRSERGHHAKVLPLNEPEAAPSRRAAERATGGELCTAAAS